MRCGDGDDGDDVLGEDHERAADEENAATTEALDDPERDRRREHVNQVGNQRDEEGVADCAKGLEEGRAEVEDEVDARELLSALET